MARSKDPPTYERRTYPTAWGVGTDGEPLSEVEIERLNQKFRPILEQSMQELPDAEI